jgi:prevent-host-death family protein
MQIAIADAKAQFSELIRRVEAGEAIELTRYGRLVARITAAQPEPKVALIGAMKGRIHIADDFDGPLSGFTEAMLQNTDPT